MKMDNRPSGKPAAERSIPALLGVIGEGRLLAAICLTSVMRTVRDLACLITISEFINILLSGRGSLTAALAWVVIAEFGGMPILALDNYFIEKYTAKSERTLMKELMSSLRSASYKWLDSQQLADIVSTATSDIERFLFWQRILLPNAIRNIVYMIGGLGYAFSRSWSMSLCILPVVIIIVPVINRFARPLNENAKRQRTAASRSLSRIQDVLFDPEFVKSYHLEESMDRRIGDAFEEQAAVEYQAVPQIAAIKALGRLSGYLPAVISTIVGAVFLINGRIEVGFLFGFVQMASQRFGFFIPQISDIISQTQAVSASSGRIMKVLLCEKEERTGGERTDGGALADPGGGMVYDLEKVSFAYDTVPVLKDIDLKIRAGQSIGIVGESGCGKSTLLKILMGLYRPTGGRFACFGRDISEWELTELRKYISPVLQNPFLFSLTLKENLDVDAEDGTVRSAIEKAGMAEYLETAEKGLDTRIVQKGASLSGGQRQRLTIARALLKDSPVLIFDEPTSALDTVTQAAFQKTFREIRKGRTSVTVSHRLALVEDCDVIYMMDRGRIAEQGTHEELIALRGSYYNLYSHQEKGGARDEK